MSGEVTVVILWVVIWALVIFIRRRKFEHFKKHVETRPRPSLVGLTLKNLRLARVQMSGSMSHEFSKLLSSALKTYVCGAYKIPSSGVTSEEMVNRLLSDARNDWSIIGLFTEVIKLADAAKYSQKKLSKMQQRGIYIKACRFILLSERFFKSRRSSTARPASFRQTQDSKTP
ncbi:MAG: hypothetical protein LBB17_02895, partial [Puniceicoccales bacterium]|nr:hypothetical protein [Puniceicoccales bacterium]